ncbi:MAG: M56 family metallopeptidase, partial [Oscillospiraceae bacterium]
MAAIFSQILNMSMTGSVVILLVMLARLILKRSSKIFSYALWSVVLFRLLCPVAFTAPISVLDVVKPEQKETSNNTSIVTYIPATVNTQADFIMVHPEEQQIQAETATEPEDHLRMTPMH